MPVARPSTSFPPRMRTVPPDQWVTRFVRLLGHWKPEVPLELATRTAADWHRSLGALDPVEAFTMYRRVANEADARARLDKVEVPIASASPRTELLDRIAAASCHSEIDRILVDLTRASGSGPVPAELAAAIMASQLRLLAGDSEFVERVRDTEVSKASLEPRPSRVTEGE